MTGALRLHVAMVWSQTLQAEHLLREARPVVLGYGDDALFPLPEAEAARGDVVLLTPSEGGVTLHLPAAASGAVWLREERHDVRSLRSRTPSVELGRGDYGVISFGAASYFFQQVREPEPARRALGSLDWEAALSLGLSVFLHGMLFALMLLASNAFPFEPTLEVKPELRARVAAAAAFLRPPEPVRRHEDIPEARDVPVLGTLDPKPLPRRKPPPAFTRAKDSEGAAAAERVRGMGLLGAISGSDGLKGALAGDSVGALLDGLGAVKASAAGTSGGRAPRGAGGGDSGALLGGGPIGTGAGGGGKGGGAGAGNKGAGKGGGKGGKGELVIALTPGAPQVSGFLSADQINRVVRANQAALRYCYETEVQRQRGLRGKVVLQWRVDRAGGVPDARVAQSTLKSAAVEGCLIRQVRKWKFPKPDGGEVSVVYPFLFGVGD